MHVNDKREKWKWHSSVSENTDLALVHNTEAFLKFDHKNIKALKTRPNHLDLILQAIEKCFILFRKEEWNYEIDFLNI